MKLNRRNFLTGAAAVAVVPVVANYIEGDFDTARIRYKSTERKQVSVPAHVFIASADVCMYCGQTAMAIEDGLAQPCCGPSSAVVNAKLKAVWDKHYSQPAPVFSNWIK